MSVYVCVRARVCACVCVCVCEIQVSRHHSDQCEKMMLLGRRGWLLSLPPTMIIYDIYRHLIPCLRGVR